MDSSLSLLVYQLLCDDVLPVCLTECICLPVNPRPTNNQMFPSTSKKNSHSLASPVAVCVRCYVKFNFPHKIQMLLRTETELTPYLNCGNDEIIFSFFLLKHEIPDWIWNQYLDSWMNLKNRKLPFYYYHFIKASTNEPEAFQALRKSETWIL